MTELDLEPAQGLALAVVVEQVEAAEQAKDRHEALEQE